MTPSHSTTSHVRPWWVAAMLAATAALPGCGSDPAALQRPSAEATLSSAQESAGQGDSATALTRFEEAIALDPRLVSAYLGAADIYRARGDYASAEQRYGKAAALEPGNFDAQYGHGLALQALGRYGEAVRAYLRAIPLKPRDFNASLNAATAYLQLGEPRQAALYAQHAVNIDPGSAPAHINLAEIGRALGVHDQAVAEYQLAAAIGELSPEALLNLADSLGEVGRYPEMADAASRVVQAHPSARAYELLGSALFRQGQYDDALADFRQALTLDPDSYRAMNGVGVCMLNTYIAGGETDREALGAALAAFRRSLQLEHNQPRVKELLARWG